MEKLELNGHLNHMGGHLTVIHTFKCQTKQPMEAVYVFQLPRNGVVRRFKVKGADFEVESKLSPREEARKEYEEGIAGGHLSTLAEIALDGVVSILVGQVQPDEVITVAVEVVSGVETRDEGYRFRFPFTLAPNYHSQSRAYTTPLGHRIDLPQDVFDDLTLPEWRSDASELHQISFHLHAESNGLIGTVSSPSHNISVQPNADGSVDVRLAGMSDHPDRDLVLDVATREINPVVFMDDSLVQRTPRASQFPDKSPRWTAMLPSDRVPRAPRTSRKVMFILDRSGSMQGSRITQARVAAIACLSALHPTDEFGLLRFNATTQVFHDSMAPATESTRARATRWLADTHPDGGTELLSAISRAIEVMGGPGDIFLITDGEVSDTGDIVEHTVASGCRVHVLGIGNAAQDRFLALLARRTGGVQRMLNVREDVAVAGLELFNAVTSPRQCNVKAIIDVEGSGTQTHDVGEVWDGRPIVITDNGTTGDSLPYQIRLEWAGERTTLDVSGVRRAMPDGTVALLWAGRQIEDLESAMGIAKTGPASKVLDINLKKLSLDFGLASRVMSLCAVVKRVGDQAGVTPSQQVVPVGLPSDMKEIRTRGAIIHADSNVRLSAFAPSRGVDVHYLSAPLASSVDYSPPDAYTVSCFASAGSSTAGSSNWSRGNLGFCDSDDQPFAGTKSAGGPLRGSRRKISEAAVRGVGFGEVISELVQEQASGATLLLSALGKLQGDGGYPGSTLQSRVMKSTLLALALLQNSAGKTTMYRAHLSRLADFLEQHVSELGVLKTLIPLFRAGTKALTGDWEPQFKKYAAVDLDAHAFGALAMALQVGIQTL
jgi:Ca-activated chloride channel family protein